MHITIEESHMTEKEIMKKPFKALHKQLNLSQIKQISITIEDLHFES